MGSRHIILGMAVMAVGTAAYAGPVSWTYNGSTAANNSWASGTSWSPNNPVFDGSEDVTFSSATISANRTLTLDGNRVINSLSATSGNAYKYTVNPGTGGIIKLMSGNLTVDGNGTSSGRPIALTNSTVQIGDGVTPVTTAIWELKNSNTTKSTLELGAIKGMTGTVLTLKGNNAAAYAGNSSEFYGVVRQEQHNADSASNIKMHLNANNALGGVGSKLIVASTAGATPVGTGNLHFNSNASTSTAVSTSHSMDIQFDVNSYLASGIASGNPSPVAYSNATLNGNLSGTGSIDVGVQAGASSVMRFGRIIVNGSNNTASGNVLLRGGRLQVDGTWTGAGNFTINRGLLAGTGSIGLGVGKTVSVLASGSSYDSLDAFSSNAAISPADAGTVGTLTIGTAGNSNSLSFNNGSGAANPGSVTRYTQFFVDVGQLAADRLNVNGDVTIGNSQVQLILNKLSSTHDAAQFVILSYTGTLTGTFGQVYYDGSLISDPTAPGAIAGKYSLSYGTGSNSAIALVPEPTSLAGLALLGGMLVRRRRSL